MPSFSASSTASFSTLTRSPGLIVRCGMWLHPSHVSTHLFNSLTLIRFILASIGILAPQKYVWKICIALHSAPRLLLCKMYHKHMQKVLNKVASVQRLALFTCVLNVAEVFSLLLLSVVPSTEDYFLHTFCFGLFLFFSAMYLAFSYYLFR